MQVSPDSTMGSSSTNDVVMIVMPAMPAVNIQNDASVVTAIVGAAANVDELCIGRMFVQNDLRQLQSWANQFIVEAERRNSASEAQIKHLIGVANDYKRQVW